MYLNQGLRDSLTGFATSAAAITITYPADTLSKRLQVSTKQTPKWTGLYKGLSPALGTQPVYWAINLPLYNAMKRLIDAKNFTTNMAIGFSSGAIATIVTNPLWMLRQRMQTEILKNKIFPSTFCAQKLSPVYVSNFLAGTYHSLVRDLYREGGFRTFFRGTTMTLVKNTQMAFLLPLFERINDMEYWKTQTVISPIVATGISAAAAKIIASTGVYPLDVIRTNMRYREGKNAPFMEITREILNRPGGVLNMFRGIGWYWISAAGTFGVMMCLQQAL